MTPKIDAEFQSYMPPLTPEERQGLETLLLGEGCRDALVVWKETGILLDGHNRLEICNKHKIKYRIEYLKFPTRELALKWVIDHQASRRNWSDAQRSYYMGLHFEQTKAGHGGQRAEVARCSGDTADKLAEQHGVSRRTVYENAQFARAVDKLGPAEREAALKGDIPKEKVIKKAQAQKNGQEVFDLRAWNNHVRAITETHLQPLI